MRSQANTAKLLQDNPMLLRLRPATTDADREVLRRVAREAKARPGTKLVVYAAPEVVKWIEAQGDDLKQSLRRHAGAGIRFEPRTNFARNQFDVGADQ